MRDVQRAPTGADTTELVLTLDCPEDIGIVHAVTGVLLRHGCTIAELKQFDDRRQERFFMRVHVVSPRSTTATVSSARPGIEPSAG